MTYHDEQAMNPCRPLEGDDKPVALTGYQASKCAAILEAYAKGHIGWVNAVQNVILLLHALAAEVGSERVKPEVSTSELWSRIDAEPWPPSGSSRPRVVSR